VRGPAVKGGAKHHCACPGQAGGLGEVRLGDTEEGDRRPEHRRAGHRGIPDILVAAGLTVG
jgi:hypothetical protein